MIEGIPPAGPATPGVEERAWLLAELAHLIARGGGGRFVAAPLLPTAVAMPVADTPVAAVRGLVGHLAEVAAVSALDLTVVDRRDAAVIAARRAVTDLEVEAFGDGVALAVYALGADDVAGAVSLALGSALARAWPRETLPYRADPAEDSDDLAARGAVAAVWCGLGVLAANASYQQYAGGVYDGARGFAPLEYDVIRAGGLPMPALAYLLAVQAELRGAELPDGLGGPQRDEATAWRSALRGRREDLLRVLGLDASDSRRDAPPRLPRPSDRPEDLAVPLARLDGTASIPPRGAMVGRTVFRTSHRRVGTAMLAAGAAALTLGLTLHGGAGAVVAAVVFAAVVAMPPLQRCASCLERLARRATTCPRCGGTLGAIIADRAQRLDADEG